MRNILKFAEVVISCIRLFSIIMNFFHWLKIKSRLFFLFVIYFALICVSFLFILRMLPHPLDCFLSIPQGHLEILASYPVKSPTYLIYASPRKLLVSSYEHYSTKPDYKSDLSADRSYWRRIVGGYIPNPNENVTEVFGSGFFLSFGNHIWLVSNHHVLKYASNIQSYNSIFSDKFNDLALVHLRHVTFNSMDGVRIQKISNLSNLQLNNKRVSVEGLCRLGYLRIIGIAQHITRRLAYHLNLDRSYLNHFMIRIQSPINPIIFHHAIKGCSGSPVVDLGNNDVVGVLSDSYFFLYRNEKNVVKQSYVIFRGPDQLRALVSKVKAKIRLEGNFDALAHAKH